MTDSRVVVWRFATIAGSVRLLLEVEESKAPDLHTELAGCAIVADDLDEFMRLAHRAVDLAGGMIGELMKGPWPSQPLKDSLRAAARRLNTIEAAEAIIAAAGGSTAIEAEQLLDSPEWQVEREIIRGVLYGLDELAQPVLGRLALALVVPIEKLAASLDLLG